MAVTIVLRVDHTGSKLETFVTCAVELPVLISVLDMINVAERPMFDFKFDVQPGASSKLTRSLLTSFKRLRGASQICKVNGCLDGILQQVIQTAMTPRVLWSRKRHHDYYRMILQRAMIACEAIRASDWALATSTFQDIKRYNNPTSKLDISISRSDDTALGLRYRSLRLHLIVDEYYTVIQTYAASIMGGEFTERCKSFMNVCKSYLIMLDRTVAPKLMLLRGILEFECAGPYFDSLAVHTFRSLTLTTESERLASICLDIIQSYDHRKASIQDTMKRMLDLVNPAFCMVRCDPVISLLPGLARERYILKELGYDDDFLETEIFQMRDRSARPATNDSHHVTFDKSKADLYIAEVKSKLETIPRWSVTIGPQDW